MFPINMKKRIPWQIFGGRTTPFLFCIGPLLKIHTTLLSRISLLWILGDPTKLFFLPQDIVVCFKEEVHAHCSFHYWPPKLYAWIRVWCVILFESPQNPYQTLRGLVGIFNAKHKINKWCGGPLRIHTKKKIHTMTVILGRV